MTIHSKHYHFFKLVYALGFLLVFQIYSHAQEPVATSTPTLEEITLQAQQITQEFYRREMENFDFADYVVVYLTGPDAPDSELITSAQNVAERFSAQIVHTWDEVEQILTASPIDILFVHASTLENVNREWIPTAYRSGTMIVGFSVPFEEFTELVGDACAKNENPFVPERFTEWFLYLIYWSTTTPADSKPVVDAAVLDNCNNDYDGIGAAITHGAAFLGLDRSTELEEVAGMLTLHILNRKQQRMQMPSVQATSVEE